MSSSKKTTQTRAIPEWLESGSRQAVGRAQEIADRPYEGFEGQRIADLSEAETRAGEIAMTGAEGQGSFVDADMQAYMNPYITGALDPALREIREQGLREQQGIKGQAGKVGAFGGARQAILESEGRRGTLEAVGDVSARGYAGAFESARDQFNRDRDFNQKELRSNIQNLLTTGGLKRNLEQAGLDFDFQQFTEARDWDIGNLDVLMRTLQGVPAGETITSKQKKSAMSNILGVAATAAGAYFTGGASLAAAGKTGGVLKKIGVGFGEMLGGAGAGMGAFGGDATPMPGYGTPEGGVGAGGGSYQTPPYIPQGGFDPYNIDVRAPDYLAA